MMKIELRHPKICYFYTRLPQSVNVNYVYKYIVNLDTEMCYVSLVYLL
jgi:hypothetical protein